MGYGIVERALACRKVMMRR